MGIQFGLSLDPATGLGIEPPTILPTTIWLTQTRQGGLEGKPCRFWRESIRTILALVNRMSAELGEPTQTCFSIRWAIRCVFDSQQFPKRVLISDLPALVGTEL